MSKRTLNLLIFIKYTPTVFSKEKNVSQCFSCSDGRINQIKGLIEHSGNLLNFTLSCIRIGLQLYILQPSI